MGEDSVVENPPNSGNFYRYRYNPDTKAMDYLGPVGQAPTLTEEEFQKWALFREHKELTPKELEKFYESTLKLEEDVEVTLDEAYGTVVDDTLTEMTKYHLLPGHELVIEVTPGEEMSWSIDNNDRVWVTSDEQDNGDKPIGEFDTLQQAIKAAEKDAIKRRDSWAKSKHEKPLDWVKEKAKKVNPKWLKEVEREEEERRKEAERRFAAL